jgi:hypothetical protein
MKVPVYKKIFILKKINSFNSSHSIIKETYENSGLVITGNYMIITSDVTDENSLKSTGVIIHLDNIDSYQTHT